jgi:uncharacterized protein
MRPRALHCLALAFVLLFAAAQVGARPVPLLWTVSKGDARVHLLGSFHMLRPSDYPMDASIERAYASADRLVFEVDIAEMRSPETAKGLLQAAHFDDGQTLRGVLPEDVRTRLEAFMGAAAVAGSDTMKPWFISMNLAVSTIVQAGFNPALGMDAHFMRRASDDGKPLSGLETAAEQIHALSAAPIDEQVLGLSETLRPTGELRQYFEDLHGFWRGGDADAIERLMVDELIEKTPVTARLINADRNLRWLPKIEALLDAQGETLVIVGALHLVGDVGVVELLRARGHTVERVAADGL